MSCSEGKRALMSYANSESLDKRAHPCSLIWTLSIHRLIPHYPLILKVDNEGPDQPARTRRLIWACVARNCIRARFLHCASYMSRHVGKTCLHTCALNEESNQPTYPLSLNSPIREILYPSLSKRHPVKILIRLRECAGFAQSDQNLRWARMSEGTFSDVGAHTLFPL